jgi:hypothetical protein
MELLRSPIRSPKFAMAPRSTMAEMLLYFALDVSALDAFPLDAMQVEASG